MISIINSVSPYEIEDIATKVVHLWCLKWYVSFSNPTLKTHMLANGVLFYCPIIRHDA